MKTCASILVFLLAYSLAFGQYDPNSGSNSSKLTLSYQELLNRMTVSRDSIFTLEDALIKFNPESDQRFLMPRDSLGQSDSLAIDRLDTLYVNSKILLENVEFGGIANESRAPVFLKVKFEEPVEISGSRISERLGFHHCVFNSDFQFSIDESTKEEASIYNELILYKTLFKGFVQIRVIKGVIRSMICTYDPVNRKAVLSRENNIFSANHEDSAILLAKNNFVKRDSVNKTLVFGRMYTLRLWDNTFESDLGLVEASVEDITMIRNTFSGLIDLTNTKFESYKSELYANQLLRKIGVYSNEFDGLYGTWRPERVEAFSDTIAAERFFNVFRRLTEHFRIRGNTRDYNRMYAEMKDFETMQLHYYYAREKSLSTFFSWQMNRLLGIISDYGTRPTKSIIYSVYVILAFALIYVFFPNSWDTQGRKRLIDRYTFFLKYLRKDAGIDEVYLENKLDDLKDFNAFKNHINESQQEVPKFFTNTALAIYNWGISGTYLSAKFLSKFDVLKGRWKDLPQSKRIWKSILVTAALIVALIYDLFIKALNALMLSVNAFTTLGFGEIPIKGVPRYLAIIQGFIGWFMLTIFSVSLISQLLN